MALLRKDWIFRLKPSAGRAPHNPRPPLLSPPPPALARPWLCDAVLLAATCEPHAAAAAAATGVAG